LKREGQQHSGREAANLSGTPETGEVADLSSNRRGGGRPEHALGEILAADRRWLACLARTRQGMLVAGNGDPSPCAPLLLTVVCCGLGQSPTTPAHILLFLLAWTIDSYTCEFKYKNI
jgi:hypothetical protein